MELPILILTAIFIVIACLVCGYLFAEIVSIDREQINRIADALEQIEIKLNDPNAK